MLKEMTFQEAVNFKKENPDVEVYMKYDDNTKTKLFLRENNLINYNYGNHTFYTISSVDVNATWYAEIPEKTRTHSEIMGNWFKYKGMWEQVFRYCERIKAYNYYNGWRNKDFFNDLEMLTDEQMKSMED